MQKKEEEAKKATPEEKSNGKEEGEPMHIDKPKGEEPLAKENPEELKLDEKKRGAALDESERMDVDQEDYVVVEKGESDSLSQEKGVEVQKNEDSARPAANKINESTIAPPAEQISVPEESTENPSDLTRN